MAEEAEEFLANVSILPGMVSYWESAVVSSGYNAGTTIHPRVVYVPANGKVWGAYQNSSCRANAFVYDPVAKKVESVVSLGGSGLTADGHGGPAICIDASGYIRVFYGSHATAQYYKRSTNVWDISSWEAEQSLPGTIYTYPTIYLIGSTYYLFFRTCWPSTPWGWGYITTTDFSTWTSTVDVLNPGNINHNDYVLVRQDAAGNIHMVWCLYDSTIPARRHLWYAYTTDMTTWRKRDGTAYSSLPINNTAAEKIYDSGTNVCNMACGDIQFDSNNYPMILFPSGGSWRFIKWDGDSWNQTNIASGTNQVGEFVYGILKVDDDNNLRVFCEFGGATFHGGTLKEYRSSDGGSTWSYYQTIETGCVGCMTPIVNGISGIEIAGGGCSIARNAMWVL